MIKFACNKLVRDKTVKRMKNAGIITHYTILKDEYLCDALKQKLIEESNEVKDASDRKEIISELADVFEVIESLCRVYKISDTEIQLVKQDIREKRGGFEEGIFSEAIEMNEDNPWVKHFRKSPEKYPEV